MMMKKKSIFSTLLMAAMLSTVFITVHTESSSQSTTEESTAFKIQDQWNQTFSGLGYSDIFSTIETLDGGYLIAGNTFSNEMMLWLMKVDLQGELVWNKTYQGSGDHGWDQFTLDPTIEQGSDLIEFSGGYLVFGYAGIFNTGIKDMWLININQRGQQVWNYTYGGYMFSQIAQEEGIAFIEDSNGDFLLAGLTNFIGAGVVDMWLVKVDQNGVQKWNQSYGGISSEWIDTLIETDDRGYLLVGTSSSFQLDGEVGGGDTDILVIKVDTNGLQIWNSTYGSEHRDSPSSVIKTSDNGFLIAGLGNSGIFLIKIDQTGQQLWDQTFIGTHLISIQKTSDNGFVSLLLDRHIISQNQETRSYNLFKVSNFGVHEWNQTLTFTERNSSTLTESVIPTFITTSDGGFLLTGEFKDSSGKSDIFLVKINNLSVLRGQGTITSTTYYVDFSLLIITGVLIFRKRRNNRDSN